MTSDADPMADKPLTAAELRKLPRERRDALLEAAAQLAQSDYENNPELTAFEAFDPIDVPTQGRPR
ncbi:MAG: hypothetical protein WD894_23185 [Pirellulales bacterium]